MDMSTPPASNDTAPLNWAEPVAAPTIMRQVGALNIKQITQDNVAGA